MADRRGDKRRKVERRAAKPTDTTRYEDKDSTYIPKRIRRGRKS